MDRKDEMFEEKSTIDCTDCNSRGLLNNNVYISQNDVLC
jgi:hypothetical protein